MANTPDNTLTICHATAERLAKMLQNKFAPLLTGEPGVGKTEIITLACELAFGSNFDKDGNLLPLKERKYKLYLLHPAISDPTDFKGLPALVDGNAEFLPIGDLRRLTEKHGCPVVAALDDLGQAMQATQAALMHPIQAGEVGGHKISDEVRWIGATNRVEDGAGVKGIISPLLSRFHSIIPVTADIKGWSQWAAGNGTPPELIAFCNWKPKYIEAGFSNWIKDNKGTKLSNFPCPRTIYKMGQLLNVGFNPSNRQDLCILEGATGGEFAGQFRSFVALRDELPNIRQIEKDPENAKLSTKAGAQWAAIGMCIEHINEKNARNVVTYLQRFSDELEICALRQLVHMGENNRIDETAFFNEWLTEKEDLIM